MESRTKFDSILFIALGLIMLTAATIINHVALKADLTGDWLFTITLLFIGVVGAVTLPYGLVSLVALRRRRIEFRFEGTKRTNPLMQMYCNWGFGFLIIGMCALFTGLWIKFGPSGYVLSRTCGVATYGTLAALMLTSGSMYMRRHGQLVRS